ncbi:MAG: PQQ-dependent sugar dehydrogenase [Bacteroidota bacterium]|nr:PQQ-dependent sugar dehydrogenase [Bacteroidota bacterium]
MPGSIYTTPRKDIPLQAQLLEVPAQFRSFVPSRTVYLPVGWRARVFYAGSILSKPRFMAWSPDSVLHIADVNAGRIIALPDRNRDGIADTAIIAASNVFAHDVKFYNGAMYAAEERQILRFTNPDRNGVYQSRSVFIANIAEGATQPGGGHRTRTIVFDPARRKIYLSIGSLCNVCREEFRALIEEWNDDGTGRRVMASGVRNAVGMTLHPRTGKLWATNNGSDWQGNDIPPEWIDIVRDGGFYGYPFAHSYQAYFNFNAGSPDYRALLPITAEDSARVRRMVPPAALITAHSAPMAIEFAHAAFPPEFRRGAFVALRGSWNRQPLTGYKVIYLDFDNDADTIANSVSDFLTGFLTDSIRGERWARPVGLASDARGNLYVGSDEITRFILILMPPIATGKQHEKLLRSELRIYPNPCSDKAVAQIVLDTPSLISLAIYNVLGARISSVHEGMLNAGEHTIPLDYPVQAAETVGLYFCRLETREGVLTQPLLRIR